MNKDPQHLIQSLIHAEYLKDKATLAHAHRPHCTITVSRQCGSLGESLAERLAERLDLYYYDRALLEETAKQADVDPAIFAELDESVKGMRSNWLEMLFTQKPLHQEQYLQSLINVIVGISRYGGVILGRGANFVLSGTFTFRLRVVGTLPIRAGRYAAFHGVDLKVAEERVKAIDYDRDEFVRHVFNRDIDQPDAYDLIINSDRLGVEAMVDLVVEALRAGHFCHRPDHKDCLGGCAEPESPG